MFIKQKLFLAFQELALVFLGFKLTVLGAFLFLLKEQFLVLLFDFVRDEFKLLFLASEVFFVLQGFVLLFFESFLGFLD